MRFRSFVHTKLFVRKLVSSLVVLHRERAASYTPRNEFRMQVNSNAISSLRELEESKNIIYSKKTKKKKIPNQNSICKLNCSNLELLCVCVQ